MSAYHAATIAARTVIVIAALTLVALPARAVDDAKSDDKKPAYKHVLIAEGKSQKLCEAEPGRVFVRHKLGTACISYFATSGHDSARRAIVFMDGDVAIEKYADEAALAADNKKRRVALQSNADRLKVRYIVLSRLGVDGSSGNHGERRKPDEMFAMNAAIDALKTRLGFDEVVLAGQSGGSTIAASLLTLGRNDVTCAVLGSGAYALADLVHANILKSGAKITRQVVDRTVYDPSKKVSGIAKSPARRIFLLADSADTRTPYDQQLAFAKDVARQGHHARLAPITAADNLKHGATPYTLPIAAMCARDLQDGQIASAIGKMRANVERSAEKKVSAVTPPATTSTASR